jgi:hypothetical protein
VVEWYLTFPVCCPTEQVRALSHFGWLAAGYRFDTGHAFADRLSLRYTLP